jgi:peptidoglycan/LPS O-acetylase OafA/YrhL
MNSNKGRMHELDSLRALAAIGVIGWHYTNHFQASPLAYLMAPFYRHGLLLVDFFFVLSGYVLARTYWTAERSASFALNMRDRIARIYPLHFAMLCVVAIMQWVLIHRLSSPPFIYTFNDKRDFALNLLLLNRTGLERGFSYNATSWSISTEFVVNILFLSAILARRRVAAMLVAAGFVVALAIELHNGLISNATFYGIDNDIFRTIFGFAIGVGLYRFDEALIEHVNLKRSLCDLLVIAAVVAFLYYCARGRFTQYSDLLVTLTCFPALIVGATRGGVVKALLRLPPLVYLGTLSYSIYLVHYPLQLALHVVSVATGMVMPYGNAFFLIGFLLLTFAVASLTYRFIEIPCKRLIRGSYGVRTLLLNS